MLLVDAVFVITIQSKGVLQSQKFSCIFLKAPAEIRTMTNQFKVFPIAKMSIDTYFAADALTVEIFISNVQICVHFQTRELADWPLLTYTQSG